MELKSHPFFQGVAPEHTDFLAGSAQIRKFPRHAVIFEENTPSDSFFLVMEGSAAFQKRMPDGIFRTISSSKAGEFFGELGVLTGEPRSLRAVAKEDVVLAEVPGSALREYLRGIPGPLLNILNGIINHLRETTQHYVRDLLRQEKLAVIGNMMDSIIRDFKTPFSIIGMGAQIMRANYPDEKTERLCRNIEAQVDHMISIARELSEFARGQQDLRKTPVNLKKLLARFREINYNFFGHENIGFEISMPDVCIYGQEDKLLLALKNLVANAVDAIGEKQGKVSITGEAISDSLVRVEITDNGEGVPEAVRKNLFDPFVTCGRKQGTGLGAAVAQAIIQAHGGTIRFETETGKGSTFFIKLPLLKGCGDSA